MWETDALSGPGLQLAKAAGVVWRLTKAQKRKKVLSFEENLLAQAILREGREIQDRFSAKPVYAKTGKGFLKSAGVEEIGAAKAAGK
jgi:hypothetical protein